MMRRVSVLGRWAALAGAALLAGASEPAAATRAYLARLSPEERARSDAYFEGGYWIQLSLVLFPLLLVVLYGVFRRAPRTWWLWGAGVALFFLLVVLLLASVYIDPLFNTYEPLADERVREPILSMARSSGIDVDDVYEFDASRQTTRISANVSGFLGTMRIRLNDNLLNRTSLPEIEAVMGHEVGHYVPDGFAEVALKLGEYRKLDPGAVEEWIFFDHPSGRARIRMAMDWKAENLDR